jgi:hypothetical protein
MGVVMNITFSLLPGNIVTSQGKPYYLKWSGEEADFRFKVKLKVLNITLIDDTITGTNRGSQGQVQLWSTCPIPIPSAPGTTGGDTLVIEVYDLANQLWLTREIPIITSRSWFLINFVDENGTPIRGRISLMAMYLVGTIGYRMYYYTEDATSIAIPYALDVDKSFIEFVYVRKDGLKYYYLARIRDFNFTDTVIQLQPKNEFTVEFTFQYTKDTWVKLISSTVEEGKDYAKYLWNVLSDWERAKLFVDTWMSNYNFAGEIVDIKYTVSQGVYTVKAYMKFDIPVLAVLAIVLVVAIVGAVAVWKITDYLKEAKLVDVQIKLIDYAQAVLQFRQLMWSKIVEACEQETNQDKKIECIQKLVQTTGINQADPNLLVLTEMYNNYVNSKNESDKYKTYFYMALVGAGVLALVLFTQRR